MKYGISGITLGLVIAISGFGLTGCQNGGQGSEGGIVFEEYSVKGVGVGNDRDSICGEFKDYNGVWQVSSRGILPKKIGKHDITSLRDTLSLLANLDFNSEKPAVRFPEYIIASEEKLDSASAKSLLASNIIVDRLTPKVVVFRTFTFQMPEGAAHGVYSTSYINYDITTGKILTFRDIFVNDYEPQLLHLIGERLADGRELLVSPEEIGLPNVVRLTEDGVEFLYGLYEIAPYSEGEPRVLIYYSLLRDLLTPEMQSIIF